jgi:hypothetical protein
MFSGGVQEMRSWGAAAARVWAARARAALTEGGRPIPMKSLMTDRILPGNRLRYGGVSCKAVEWMAKIISGTGRIRLADLLATHSALLQFVERMG